MIESRHEQLHRYLDDVLTGPERAAFEALLADDAELALEVEAMSFARDLLRADVSASVDAADFTGFGAAVAAQIADVVVAPARRPAPPAKVSAEAPGGLRGWWQRNWTPLVVSAAAAAVIGGLMFQSRPGADDEDFEVQNGAVAVDSIQNEGNKTILVSMPAEDGEATVIWMLDEEDTPDAGPVAGEDPI